MKSKIIMLVEDREDDIELILEAFDKNKIKNEVIIFRDGEEALDFLNSRGEYKNKERKNMPAMVLLDLKLPGISGHEVLKDIRSNEATKFLPVIILTSSKEETDILKCYENGVNSYVVKPIDFKEFIEAVRNIGLYWLIVNEMP